MATFTEDDVVNQVWKLLRDYGSSTDQQLLTDTEIKDFLHSAERIYSNIRPREHVFEDPATGTHYLTIVTTGVDAYEEGFSSINFVETPIDQFPRTLVDARDYYVEKTPSVLRLVWEADMPPVNQVVRLSISKSRTYDSVAANTTVLDSDHYAVCDLTASICADAIAAKYARTSEPSFNADAVNYRTRTQEWQSIAKRLWSRWEAHMGIGSGGEGSMAAGPAASAWVNWDLPGVALSHPRLSR
jgi:hypothetical protein